MSETEDGLDRAERLAREVIEAYDRLARQLANTRRRKNAATMQKLRAERKKQGLCIHCGKVTTKRSSCLLCRVKAHERKLKHSA